MKFTTKIGLGAAAAMLAVLTPIMATAGWYPQRELRKWDGPNTVGYDHVQFNSFYNTPGYGNETEFFDGTQTTAATQATGGANPYKDTINVTPGQELYLRTYVHNNADRSLNTVPDGNGGFKGIAQDTKVKIALPNAVGTRMNAVSQISASNAQPGSVFDTVNFQSANNTPFRLSYVAGSAVAHTNSNPNLRLSDSIVTSGALIGEATADGKIPGCFEFAEYVIVKVKVEAAPLQIQKTVGIPGQTFVEQVEAMPSDRLYFKIDFKNDGPATQNGVVLTDKLPTQFELIPGSVKLYNAERAKINPATGKPFSDEALSDTALFSPGGQPVGVYAAGTNGYILYQVRLKQTFTGALVNVACVRSSEIPYDKCDDAKIITRQTQPLCPAGFPVGDSRCTPIPPTNPGPNPNPVLPETGVESGLAGIAGMTGITTAVHAYRKSRKAAKLAQPVNKAR